MLEREKEQSSADPSQRAAEGLLDYFVFKPLQTIPIPPLNPESVSLLLSDYSHTRPALWVTERPYSARWPSLSSRLHALQSRKPSTESRRPRLVATRRSSRASIQLPRHS